MGKEMNFYWRSRTEEKTPHYLLPVFTPQPGANGGESFLSIVRNILLERTGIEEQVEGGEGGD